MIGQCKGGHFGSSIMMMIMKLFYRDNGDDEDGDDYDEDQDGSTDNFYCLVQKTERTENEKIWLLSYCLINNLLQ